MIKSAYGGEFMNNSEKITEFINSVQRITDIGICFYDLENYFHYNTLGIKDNRGHYCEFCKCIRILENGRAECDKSDRFEAINYAAEYKRPFFFKCHMGMSEICIPLYSKEMLLGVVFVGQCRTADSDTEFIKKRISDMGGDDKLFSRFLKLPLISKETMLDTANIISRFFDAMLIGGVQENEDLFKDESLPLPVKISEYISSNYRYTITTSSIAKMLFMNPSYISRIFKEHTGMTITEYTNSVRIENAKNLLEISTISIGSIALNTGFNDANYFSRTFKKITGMTPEEYRKKF